MNYNVNSYTIPELLQILDLNNHATSDEVMENTNNYINRFSPSRENRPDMVTFFQSVQSKLLRYLQEDGEDGEDENQEDEDGDGDGGDKEDGEDQEDGENEYTPDTKQTQAWIKYEALPQNDTNQKNKITDRAQKIDIYDNNHMPMNREQLGVNNNFQVPVTQDVLNPNLENVTSRFINLDSQFRQASGGSESMSTDYTMDLSDPLTNVLSLRLYSIQIPYTWYTIDTMYGNTCFWVTNASNSFRIQVNPGNYSPADFCTELNSAFTNSVYFAPPYTNTTDQTPGPHWNAGFTYTGPLLTTNPIPSIAVFNPNNGKITLYLDGWTDPANNPISTITQYQDTFQSVTNAYFTFFDMTASKSCYGAGGCGNQAQTHTFDSTLGWLMGFRLPLQPVFSSTWNTTATAILGGGNTPQGVLNLYGTKYFLVVLDDYNQNHINNGLITITELSKSLPLPSYYNAGQPYVCSSNTAVTLPSLVDIDALGNLSNITPAQARSSGINPDNLMNSLQDKNEVNVGNGNSLQQFVPSAPRTLTQAQIYTINEIIKNRSKTISFRGKAPTNSDTFAIIPIKYGSITTGQLYTELSGQFQDNKRVYFGPVDIDRLRIRLLDDRGNVVDLHGSDWSVTLISDNLYQY
jgi:hypothetical protein